MAAGTWTFPTGTRTKLLDGTLDLDTNTFKIALFNSSWSTATQTYSTTNELATANGYTQGGQTIALSLSGTTTVTVDATDEVWTASGGSITACYAVIYKDTAGLDILCYCLLDSTPADVTATDGNTLTVQIHASGVFTLA